ncbi:hypothetical protein ATANTOWER_023934 [Ataeniobius toweri]|uniref:Uncharacterized protein n=1 Tax=Ataeniobius toweri TaxID=208326 RepID=A0ABU7BCA0_9TELE|nr:hypothetical protein [Ataeniobius toweri]
MLSGSRSQLVIGAQKVRSHTWAGSMRAPPVANISSCSDVKPEAAKIHLRVPGFCRYKLNVAAWLGASSAPGSCISGIVQSSAFLHVFHVIIAHFFRLRFLGFTSFRAI